MKEPSWDELLTTVGKNVEDVGRMLRGRGRKKPRVWTINELKDLRDALRESAKTLDIQIKALRDEEKKK